MDWSIDSARPIWIQLSEQLTRRIVSGQYPMSARLPSVRELAEEAGVNPNTMQRALAHLEDQGLAVGKGTQGRSVTEDEEKIRAVRLELARESRARYVSDLKALGFTPEEAAKLFEEGD